MNSSHYGARCTALILAVLLFWAPLVPARVRAEDRDGPRREWSTEDQERLDRELDERGPLFTRDDLAGRDDEAEASSPEEQAEPSDGAQATDLTPLALPTGPAKSAVTPQTVALPRGEGSIEGMGESFSPSLSSGTGTFTVPVALPKGRAGVQPSLALSYATSGGNGPLGIGWSLGVPFISRQTDKGLPRYVDQAAWHVEEDTFMYNGGQELVPVDGDVMRGVDGAPVPDEFAGWQQYRARVEGGFMRFFRAPDSSRWVVQAKDGTRFEFGEVDGVSARESDPEDEQRTFQWGLLRMSDVHGSTVHYRYALAGGRLHLTDAYYTSPDWCGREFAPRPTRECAAPLSSYAHRVHLVYEERDDVWSSYVTGWRTETPLRLARIEITSAAEDEGQRYLVRRYHLRYQSGSYHSLLASVQVEGRPSRWDDQLEVWVGDDRVPEETLGADVVGELLPPMAFEYSAPPSGAGPIAGFGGIDATVHESPQSPDHSVDEGRSDLFDVNADGLPDLLVTDPTAYDRGVGVYFNGLTAGGVGRPGSFSGGVRVDVAGALDDSLNFGSNAIIPMDVDGDGRSDVLHIPSEESYGYFVLSKVPPAAGQPFRATEGWSFYYIEKESNGQLDPRIDFKRDASRIKVMDVDNDHLVDVVRTSGSSVQTWLNLGRYPGGAGRFGTASASGSGWTLSSAPIESCLPRAAQAIDFADSRVRIADMNGDGLSDLVRIGSGDVVWWPGRGPGVWGDGPRVCTDQTGAGRERRLERPSGLRSDLQGFELFDVNEDGASDFVQVGFSDISIWYNRAGEGFTERLLVSDTPFNVSVLGRVRVADIDGSTTSDIIFGDAGNWRWIDPMGGKKPRLLTRVHNGLGALTTLEYGSSVEDYLRDLAASRSCDPEQLDCFTWQRAPRNPSGQGLGCDANVLAQTGFCAQRPLTSPVVSSVVRRVRTSDQFDALGLPEGVSETEYRYHDGYYEGIEQEFRGFGAADAIQRGDAVGPTSITRTHFHQGRRPNRIATDRTADNPNEALKGREFLSETFDEQGKYLSTNHATYTVRTLVTGLNGVRVSYAYVGASDEYRYDTAVASQTPLRSVSLASVQREVAGRGVNAFGASSAEDGDTPHLFWIRHTGFAKLSNTIDVVDNVGNMRRSTAWGRAGRGEFGESVEDERIVQVSVPVRIDDRGCGDSGWLWRTEETYTNDARGNVNYGETRSTFTQCGDVRLSTRTATLPATAFDFSGAGSSAGYTQASSQELASSELDKWGQPLAVCGGAELTPSRATCLRLSTLSYEAVYGQLVTRESVATERVNGVPTFLSSAAVWDRGLGVVRSVTDPNGQTSEMVYDGLGRVTASVVPPAAGCAGARVPAFRISYDLTSAPESRPVSRIGTTAILSCGGYNHPDNQVLSYTYVDGLGRNRATLSEGDTDGDAWQDGQPHAWTRGGLALFDRKGQPHRGYQTAFYEGSPDEYANILALPSVPYTSTYYDAFGRPTLEVNEDLTYRTRSYHALSADLCDEVDNGFGEDDDDAFIGTCTTERSDGHGRVIDQQLRQRGYGEAQLEHHRLFSYYRADGAVARVVRALTGSNVLRPETGYSGLTRYVERRFWYDTLGRRIASEDPDTDNRAEASLTKRTWRYLFNPAGDLAAVRDPRGCGQNFYYDLAGRLIGEAYVGCAEAQAGEGAVAQVPAGSVGLALTTAAADVHARYLFDAYPGWATSKLPAGYAGVLGRPTATLDRAQRSAVAYDVRGNVVWSAKQLAVIADEATLTSAATADGRPAFKGEDETTAASSLVYDESQTYERTTRYDFGNRAVGLTLPSSFLAGASTVAGELAFRRTGAPRAADVVIDAQRYPVIAGVSYTRDGLPARVTYGDQSFTGRSPTTSTTLYDARRRPVELTTVRTPLPSRVAGTLGAVSVVMDQRLTWDASSNLHAVEDLRPASEWPSGHKPVSQTVHHDALYRVAQVDYDYATPSKLDQATDFRETLTQHRATDPMRSTAAPMLAQAVDHRVMTLSYRHDWLANMTSWDDDSHQFYERSVGTLTNGNDVASGLGAAPSLRPSALYLSSNLDATTPADLGGWLETDFGGGGNMLAMTVHARCTTAVGAAATCADPSGADVEARRAALRARCSCASEQHYLYRWDELNRLHEARRYDRTSGGAWTLAARQRYRYDAGNQRTVKQTLEPGSANQRVALYVYPGDFERRGLRVSDDGLTWHAHDDAESQYLVAGARIVWRGHDLADGEPERDQRITLGASDLIETVAAVFDLVSGELIESSSYYPNGARETAHSEEPEDGRARIALEPAGFTGKEADEEVGLTYFGERYLVPRIGRWASPDPLAVHAMGGGEAGNSYHYVSGNLLQARDPLGLECGSDCSCMETDLEGAPNYNSEDAGAISVASPSQSMPAAPDSVHLPNGDNDDPSSNESLREQKIEFNKEIQAKAPAGSVMRTLWKVPHRANVSDRIKDTYMDGTGTRLTMNAEEMKDIGEGVTLTNPTPAYDPRNFLEMIYLPKPPSLPSEFTLQVRELRGAGGGTTYVEGRVFHEASEGGTLGRYFARYSGVLHVDGRKWDFQGYMSFHDLWDFDFASPGREPTSALLTAVGALMPGEPIVIDSTVVPIEQRSGDVQVRWVDEVKPPSYLTPSFRD